MTGKSDQENLVVDGSDNFGLGVDGGKRPRLVSPQHVVRGTNITVRNGEISNRPGFKKISLTFDKPNTQTTVQTGLFQRAAFYSSSNSNVPMLVASISGQLFRFLLQPNAVSVDRIPIAGPNASNKLRAWFCEADNYLICQDGQSKPIIYDGGVAKRAVNTSQGGGTPQVPVGTAMVAGQGRLFVKTCNSRIRAGDISGTKIGSILNFTETELLSGGGDFGPDASQGEISGMAFLATQDTATGQGPLLSFGPGGATSYNVQNDRTVWQNGLFATQALTERGSIGNESIVSVNGDLWFRSLDGWRSFRSARAETLRWPRTTMSNEIIHRIRDESPGLLPWGSAVYFDNRLIATAMPQKGPQGIYHLGMVALDFFPISSIRQLSEFNPYTYSSPAWEDLWTGIQPFQILSGMVAGQLRCFAFCYDQGQIALYEISLADPFDNYGSSNQPILSLIEFPGYFAKSQVELKQLFSMQIGFAGYQGDVEVEASYRPDDFALWFPWGTKNLRSQYLPSPPPKRNLPYAFEFNRFVPPEEPRLVWPSPPAVPVPGKDMSDKGYVFQVKLEIQGAYSISWLRLFGRKLMENLKANIYGDAFKTNQ
jgi:hypothetical protein